MATSAGLLAEMWPTLPWGPITGAAARSAPHLMAVQAPSQAIRVGLEDSSQSFCQAQKPETTP